MFSWTSFIKRIKNLFSKKTKVEVKAVVNRKLDKILRKHKGSK
jgi:hypothetical protein